MEYHFAVKPCLEKMKDGGVIKKDELHVVVKDSKTQSVSIPTASDDKHEPEYASVTLTVKNVKEVTVTSVSKQNNPSEVKKVTVASTSETTVEVKFDTVVKADSITVEVTPSSIEPVKAEVTSVKACVPKKGTIINDLLAGWMIAYTCFDKLSWRIF